MSPVRFSLSALSEGRWYEHVIRFVLGGAVTTFTGYISSRYGASVGGIFLGLPAIFCASATLIEKHEVRRKREAGFAGARRGRQAAALDAAGAPLGAIGMLCFASVFALLARSNIPITFMVASFAWVVTSIAAWYLRRKSRLVRSSRIGKKAGGSAHSRGG
ncbi:DUF3147 family protein [Bradyrhizobium jicamae]|uniref:DUF3147 family protein n=1 Tax=Bradyrhizobium jicamae TaxID=280332 RepID=A0ABS5FST7_9BRAD|nr:DUF3147 family protein [Bradyrhizobium jicamae]MBR0799860.1 DUF3147 family protein [Bradyrhizobium jicamae]